MHKSTAVNMQNRAVRAALERRTNDRGSNAAFEGLKDKEDVKAALVAAVRAIDARIAILNAHIARADAVVAGGGGRTPAKTYGGWKIERANLIAERTDVQARLQHLGRYSAAAREERLRKFDCVFVDVAKEMLAAEVFERVQMATIHRIQERHEAG